MRKGSPAIVLALAAGFLAPPTMAAGKPATTPPAWLRKPTPEDLRAVWPIDAWRQGKGGKAVISCRVSVQGALFDCRVLSESPAGLGFGGAAIALTPQLLMKPATEDGRPVVGGVNIPVNFQMPPAMTPPSTFGGNLALAAARPWLEAPSQVDVAAAYPQKARAAAVGGHVSVNCHFTAAGTLRSCQVLSEDPRGQGFGEAARALTKRFRAVATLKNGKPIEGAVVQIPFTFDPQMLTSPVVGKPHWASTPSGEALKAAFPAQEAGTVRVSLACQVQQGGAVSDCKVVNESPPGHGYGANTLALASQFRLDTWTMEGLPAVGGTVIIPIRYEPVPPALAPTPAKP